MPADPTQGNDATPAETAPKPDRALPQRCRRIMARSENFAHDKGFIVIELSRPGEGEECGVTLQPMSEARLDFLPEGLAQCPIASRRDLVKGTLPCGHSFSALAILYHFAKNGMQCPNCRAGVPGRMTTQSIPRHLRGEFIKHMDRQAEAERREQAADEWRATAQLLEREVTESPHPASVLNSVEVVVFAYDSMHSLAPMSVQTLPLHLIPPRDDSAPYGSRPSWWERDPPSPSTSTTRPDGLLRFESSGYSCREMSRNLRLMGADVLGFELVVCTRDVFDGLLALFRTARFGPDAGTASIPPSGEGGPGQTLEVHCQGSLERVRWSVPRHELARLLTSGSPLLT